jgi:predicted RNase H-like nuclease (RuvC/YqgF family)
MQQLNTATIELGKEIATLKKENKQLRNALDKWRNVYYFDLLQENELLDAQVTALREKLREK